MCTGGPDITPGFQDSGIQLSLDFLTYSGITAVHLGFILIRIDSTRSPPGRRPLLKNSGKSNNTASIFQEYLRRPLASPICFAIWNRLIIPPVLLILLYNIVLHVGEFLIVIVRFRSLNQSYLSLRHDQQGQRLYKGLTSRSSGNCTPFAQPTLVSCVIGKQHNSSSTDRYPLLPQLNWTLLS